MWDDICKCHGQGCPKRLTCLRYLYRHRGGNYQTYFTESPYDKEKKACDQYMKKKKGKD